MEHRIDLEGEGFSQQEFEDIRLCLDTLLSVRAGSQPLDREFGINFDSIVGFPVNVAKNMLSLEIMEKVDRYEPRVKVDCIDFLNDEDGILRPHIHFVKAKGE